MCALWAAKPMSTRRHLTPSAPSERSSSSSASRSPDTTHESGALTTPTVSRSAHGASRGRTCASASAIESMPPRCATAAMSLPRSATRRAPSSRLSAPHSTAAAISPTLWPITASGRTPRLRHTAASPIAIANSTGCTTSTRSSGGTSVAVVPSQHGAHRPARMRQQRSVARRRSHPRTPQTPRAARDPSQATGCRGPGTRTPRRRAAAPSPPTPPDGPAPAPAHRARPAPARHHRPGWRRAHRSACGSPPPCEPPPPDPSPGATAASPPTAPPANAAPLRPGPTPEAAESQAAP